MPRGARLADAPCTGRRPARADRRSAFQAVPALLRGWRYALSPRCAGRCRSEDRRSLAALPGGAGAATGTIPVFGDSRLRPPAAAGIARERETSADDAAPCQREFRTLSQPRMARLFTAPPYSGAAPFHDRRGVQPSPIMSVSPGGGSAGDPSRLNHSASLRSAFCFGRNTPGPVLPVGAAPSRALSAGRLAPTGRTGGLGAHPGSTTGC